jgi:hypothetical protein
VEEKGNGPYSKSNSSKTEQGGNISFSAKGGRGSLRNDNRVVDEFFWRFCLTQRVLLLP